MAQTLIGTSPAPILSQAIGNGGEVLDAANLWHQDAIGSRAHRPPKVTSSIHHGRSSAMMRMMTSRLPKPPASRICTHDGIARGCRGVSRHKIFETRDDAVNPHSTGLFQRAGTKPGIW